jgi:hypothetical protein
LLGSASFHQVCQQRDGSRFVSVHWDLSKLGQ